MGSAPNVRHSVPKYLTELFGHKFGSESQSFGAELFHRTVRLWVRRRKLVIRSRTGAELFHQTVNYALVSNQLGISTEPTLH